MKKKFFLLTSIIALALIITGCSDDDDNFPSPAPLPTITAKYQVTVTNLTNFQPLSPIAVLAHNDNYQALAIGSPASLGLEILAEGGDNSALIAEAVADQNSVAQSSGTGVIGPSASETIEIEFSAFERDYLSVVTMLVNTNDAVTGRANINISRLSVGQSLTFRGLAYDAGTELNTEAAGTIPGPADGGEGFNAARDDIADMVTMHPGVVTLDDGLTTSILTLQSKFDNPVVNIVVTRTE